MACENFVIPVTAGQWIFQEGEMAENLIIPLDCELELLVNNDGELIGAGRLLPGRAAQLYSLLKGEAFHCSGRSRTDGHCLKIPASKAHEWFTADHVLRLHLDRMVSSLEYRGLSKQIQQIGISSRFLVEFLGQLTEHKLPPQQWLAQEGQVPQACFFLTRGALQVLKIDESKNYRNLWTTPEKSWALFRECEMQLVNRHSYKSIDEIHFFKIDYTALIQIKSIWEDDFFRFTEWLKGKNDELMSELDIADADRLDSTPPPAPVMSPPPPPREALAASTLGTPPAAPVTPLTPPPVAATLTVNPPSPTLLAQTSLAEKREAPAVVVPPPVAPALAPTQPARVEEEPKPFIESRKPEPRPMAKPSTPPPPPRVREAVSVGYRCLHLISQHFRKNQSPEFWQMQLAFEADDSNLLTLAKALESNSFTTKILKIESFHEIDSTRLPCIVLRKNYPMVLFQIGANHVSVGDPNLGLVNMPRKEFEGSVEKIALIAKPKPQFFKPEGSPFEWNHAKEIKADFKPWLRFATLFSAIAVFLSTLAPFFIQLYVDEVLVKKDTSGLQAIGLGLFLIVALKNFAEHFKGRLLRDLKEQFSLEFKTQFLSKIFSLPFENLVTYLDRSAEKSWKAVDHFADFSLPRMISILTKAATIASFVLVSVFYNSMVSVLLVGFTALVYFINIFSKQKYQQIRNDHISKSKEEAGSFEQLLNRIYYFKMQGQQVEARWRFEKQVAAESKARAHLEAYLQRHYLIVHLLTKSFQVACLILASYSSLQDTLTLGQFITFCIFIYAASEMTQSLSKDWMSFQDLKLDLEELNKFFLLSSESGVASVPPPAKRIRGDIEFKNVWFRYGGENSEWALRNLNLKIEAGQKVAFMGPSGSGKTTIALLLSRVYEPTQGQILLDGRELTAYDPTWLRTHFGFYFPENVFTPGSIFENITDLQLSADIERAEESAFYANLETDLKKRKQNIDLPIDSHGMVLSAGERQKLSLSKMFYHQPDALFLDECGAHLDPISEHEFFQHVKARFANATVIQVTHKFTGVKTWDQIFVIDEGRVVDRGTHEELMAVSTAYKKLFAHSFKLKSMKGVA